MPAEVHVGSTLRMLVVDDDAGIRALLEVSAQLDPRFELVGSAATAHDALESLRASGHGDDSIDVVLLDVTLPDRDGIELIGDVRRVAPDASIVLFTGWSDPGTVARARSAGADAILCKDGDPKRLLDEIARVSGERAADD